MMGVRIMKAIKAYLVLIVIIVIAVFNMHGVTDVEIRAYSSLPKDIRVGVSYGSNQVAAATVTASKGYMYGWSQSGVFNTIKEMPGGSKIFVRKDKYYVKGTNGPLEKTASTSTYGPYRIQLGANASSLSDAVSKAASYATTFGVNCYPVYRAGWKVCTGDYTSQAAAQNHIDSVLKKKNSSLAYSHDTGTSTTIVVQGSDYNTLLVFDGGTTAAFQVKATAENNPAIIQTGSRLYRGIIEYRRFSSSDMTVINILDFEEYLYGVLPNEIGYSTTPFETWKAHAITSRTFAYNSVRGGKHNNYDFDLCSTSDCQVYSGHSNDDGKIYENININNNINATKGMIVTYAGNPAQIYYSSTNGGYTEATENVWSAVIPYLKAYKDPYDPIYERTITMTVKEASASLAARGYDVGDLSLIQIKKRTASGRVYELYVKGSKGDKTIYKSSTRGAFGLGTQMYSVRTNVVLELVEGNIDNLLINKLNGRVYETDYLKETTYTVNNIPSGGIQANNNFHVETIYLSDPNAVLTFDLKGYGHGIGMSQKGAMEMGRQGKTYKEIIEFYFKGTKVE
jgi:stage II sporulation protein D